MHYTLELILPKTDNLEQEIEKILAPFNEHDEENNHAFFDWYVIGGRFAGGKLEAKLDSEKVDQFYKRLEKENIQCKGVVSGKQEIATKKQTDLVDNIWHEMFPESGLKVCPFFKHSNDQYDSSSNLPFDVCELKDVPDSYKCSRVIIAKTQYDGELGADYMISTDFWNGVSWIDTMWNGEFHEAIKMFQKRISAMSDSYQEQFKDLDSFISVTIDYHS